jgi:hypothetical protein
MLAFYAGCVALAAICSGWLIWKFGASPTGIAIAIGWIAVVVGVVFSIEQREYWLVALAIVALRTAMFWITSGQPSQTPDPRYYAILAKSLSHGRDFTDHVDGVAFTAMAPRLYSYVLAGGYYVFGGADAAPYVINFAIDVLTALLIYQCARRLGARKDFALVGSALYLIWPNVVVSSSFAHKEGIASLLTLACVWTLLRIWQDGRLRPVQFGILLGLLAMAQPAFFLMSATFSFVLLLKERPARVIRFVVIAAIASAVTLTPQIIRNWYTAGGFVPLTTGVGFNMYANATGALHFSPRYRDLPEAIWSNVMVREALKVIFAHPLNFALHQAKGLALGFGLEHYTYFSLQGVKNTRIRPVDFLPVLQLPLLALWTGALACLRYRRQDLFMVGILALALIYTLTIAIWFEFGARHRGYLLPILLPWIMAFVSGCARRAALDRGGADRQQNWNLSG